MSTCAPSDTRTACPAATWRDTHFRTQSALYGKVQYKGTGDVTVSGRVSNLAGATKIVFWAPAPPDYRTSYSGSGLPYPNAEVAFQQTPSYGTVPVSGDGSFVFSIPFPSAYYTNLGTVYVQPHVRVQTVVNGKAGAVETIKVAEGVPFRLLTYPPVPQTAPRCSPQFYGNRDILPVRTQEQVLRDSAYPSTNAMPANFWGLTPAH
jgi:hypothetical protein